MTADTLGGVFCGAMPRGESPGRLYRLSPDDNIAVVADDIGISNGIGFTARHDAVYHTETEGDAIYTYDFDADTGAVSDRRVFVDAAGDPGHPDGQTTDAAGRVWSAHLDGGCVARYTPSGEEVGRVEFPARKVSSIAFGGPGLQQAYVTAALAGGTRDEEGAGAGALFRFDPGVRGLPQFRSDVNGRGGERATVHPSVENGRLCIHESQEDPVLPGRS